MIIKVRKVIEETKTAFDEHTKKYFVENLKEIVKIEIDWNKPTIVKNFNTDLILIVVQNEDENEINFENRNKGSIFVI